MTATRILDGLEDLDLKGEDAKAAARLGFLEWVFTQTGSATPKDAQKALSTSGILHLSTTQTSSPARWST